MKDIVLVVAVHPDDETLGCGGTLLRHKAEGAELHWLIATELRPSGGEDSAPVREREEEIARVAEFYGMSSVRRLGYATTRLDQAPRAELVQAFGRAIEALEPSVLYLPFCGDAHGDHRVAFEAAYSCTKSFRHPSLRRVLMMETLSETEFAPPLVHRQFMPNVFVDVTDYLEGKLRAMRIYASELGQPPFPRSEENIRALATLRGGVAGCRAAEAFMLLREIRHADR